MAAVDGAVPACWEAALRCSCGDCPDGPQCAPVRARIVRVARGGPKMHEVLAGTAEAIEQRQHAGGLHCAVLFLSDEFRVPALHCAALSPVNVDVMARCCSLRAAAYATCTYNLVIRKAYTCLVMWRAAVDMPCLGMRP